MRRYENMEDLFPFPILLRINCDHEDFRFHLGGISLTETRERFNEKHNINLKTFSTNITDDDGTIPWNGYKFLIGTEEVLSGILSSSDAEGFENLLKIIETQLETWKDRILEIQDENDRLAQQYAQEGWDEIVLEYLSRIQDPKRFLYLKKLAKKYRNSSSYFKTLRRAYNGRFKFCKKNEAMAKKLENDWDNFF